MKANELRELYSQGERDFRKVNLGGETLSGWLEGIDLREADLSNCNLRRASLNNGNLRVADLQNANLSGAMLSKTDLGYANLSGATLHNTHLLNTLLERTNLSGADLSNALFRETRVVSANFDRSKLDNSYWNSAVIVGVDLSNATGLDRARHDGPSSVDINTLRESKGQIPKAFLRGCGLADWEIAAARMYAPKLSATQLSAIEARIAELRGSSAATAPSLFISYSTKDSVFVTQLHKDLQDRGVRCWFAPEDLRTGDRIRQTIAESIQKYDRLLTVLSTSAINSEWVESEVENAFEEERRRKRSVILPIRVDDAVLTTDRAWAAEIRRTRRIADFTQWQKAREYALALDKVINDIRNQVEA